MFSTSNDHFLSSRIIIIICSTILGRYILKHQLMPAKRRKANQVLASNILFARAYFWYEVVDAVHGCGFFRGQQVYRPRDMAAKRQARSLGRQCLCLLLRNWRPAGCNEEQTDSFKTEATPGGGGDGSLDHVLLAFYTSTCLIRA